MTANELMPVLTELKKEFEKEDYKKYSPREEEKLIDLDSSLAQVVIGVRRSGKSTLCRKVLHQSGLKVAYVNFDDERLEGLQRSDLNNVLETLYILYGDFEYLFLDEIQNVEGWPLFVNRLLRQNIHLVITGSNAKLLSNELMTHLTGRHHKIILYPFSFGEYAQFKSLDADSITTKDQALLKNALDDYLRKGGFPELFKEKHSKDYISGLMDAIIKKDITKRFKVRYPEILQRLATYLIDNVAQEYNVSSLSQMLGVSDHTIDQYCEYLQEAFLLLPIHKFSYKSRERLRAQKMYVIDNALISNRPNTITLQSLGWRLENVVYIELLRRNESWDRNIFYYRDRTFEVDFIVSDGINVEELYQVCYDMSSEKTRKREINGMLLAAKKFKCENLTIITFALDEIVQVGNLTINIVSAANWMVKFGRRTQDMLH